MQQQQQQQKQRRLSSIEVGLFQQPTGSSRNQTNPFLQEPQQAPIYQQQHFLSSMRRYRRLSDNQLDSNSSQASSLMSNLTSNYSTLHLDPNQVAISSLPVRRHSSAAPGLEFQQDQYWQQQQKQKPLHLNFNYNLKQQQASDQAPKYMPIASDINNKQQRQQETPSSVSTNSTSSSSNQSGANNQRLADDLSGDFLQAQQPIVSTRSGSLSDDVDLVFNRLMSLDAFRKLHPSVIRNLCSYASIERIDKGVIG